MRTKHFKFLTFFILSLICKISYGQDSIFTKDGRELKVKIIENDGSNIKYKNFENQEGIVKTFDVSFIDFIKYENGNIERFTVTNKENIITQIDNSDHTLDFLKRKYEKNLATRKFANTASWVGLAGLGISLVAGFTGDSDTNWELLTAFTTGSGVLCIGGIVVSKVAEYRAKHYYSRIQDLSLIVTPNQTIYAKNKPSFQNFNFGVRITF